MSRLLLPLSYQVCGLANIVRQEPKDVALSIESQKNLFEQYGEGDPNEMMGFIELSNQLRTVISIQFSIASYSWSSSFDVTEIDFGDSINTFEHRACEPAEESKIKDR